MKNGRAKHHRGKTGQSVIAIGTDFWDPTVYNLGLRTFERELPKLMKTHHRQWVVYHGKRRFGPSKSLRKLDLECEKEGIPIGERVCRVVEPDTTFDVTF